LSVILYKPVFLAIFWHFSNASLAYKMLIFSFNSENEILFAENSNFE